MEPVIRPTYCRICEAACGLLAEVRDNHVVSLKPDPDHVVSRGYACAKGTRFLEVHGSPDRLDHPLVRREGRLVPIAWSEVIEDIGTKIRTIIDRHGPHAVALYVGNPAAFGYAGNLAAHAFAKAIGTRNQFTAGSLDCNNKFAVSRLMLGYAAAHPVPDLDHATFGLLLGTNPSVSQGSFIQAPRMIERLKRIVARGGRVIVVDPRRTETAKAVGEHVSIVPETDAALLLGMLRFVFAEKLEDADTLRRYANGEDALRAAVEPFTPERVAALTGIDAERIADLARGFATAKGAFCHISTGINQGRYGTMAYAAKIALELATGHLDRPGGALLPRGALDLAKLVRFIGVDEKDQHRSRIGNFPTVLGALPTAILADEILTPGPDQVRALVVVAGNPLLSAPDGPRLRKAFERLDLLVSLDLFVNDTGTVATHVLPCADWLERHDIPLAQLQLQPQPYAQLTEAVVAPKAERREEWEILADLARAIDVPLWGKRWVDRMIRTTLAISGPRGLLLPAMVPALGLRPDRVLARNPHGLLLHREKPGDFLARRIGTRSKRVELFAPGIYGRLPMLRAELDAAVAGRRPSTFRLLSRRERLGHNSWMHCNPRLRPDEHRAYMHSSDAARLGVVDGDLVRLRSATAEIELPVALSDDLQPGTIAVPHGYGHAEDSGWNEAKARGGVNINELAPSGPDAVDEVSGMCRLVGLELEVEAVAVQQRIAGS